MPDYLIIGASAAGVACAERLRELDGKAEITVISEDEKVYSRCMLHKGLSGERDDAHLDFTVGDFFEKANIQWISGISVVQVNEVEKTVKLSDESSVPYGKLLIASGASSMILPVPNLKDGKNVYGFRTLEDVHKLRDVLDGGAKQIAIIGAGLVGMDVAYALCEMGYQPVVIEREPRVMPLQTDQYVGEQYQDLFIKHGCRFYFGDSVEKAKLDESSNVSALVLKSGEEVPCDAVVCAVSVRPRNEFLKNTSIQGMHMNYHIQTVLNRYLRASNVHVNKGVTVNEYMQTTSPDIYAAGDVTGQAAIWPEAKAMGRCAASNMVGIPQKYPKAYPYQNTSNFWGVTMLSLGKVNVDASGYRIVTHQDAKSYKKFVLKDDRLEGVLVLGDLENAGVYRHLIINQVPVNNFSDHQLVNLSFAEFYGMDRETGEFHYPQ